MVIGEKAKIKQGRDRTGALLLDGWSEKASLRKGHLSSRPRCARVVPHLISSGPSDHRKGRPQTKTLQPQGLCGFSQAME